jgi:carboxypeptidase family protein/TonB-dependent receptor-like protein
MRFTCCCLALWALPATSSAAQTLAVVRGRVLTDSVEHPIAEASVSLGDGRFRAVSDSLGRYRIPAVPPGRYAILVRRLGFAPVSTTLSVASGDSIDADFLLVPVVQDLPGVNVTGSVTQRQLAAFEDRRRLGIGRFLNEAEIQKAPGTRLSEKLRQLPGLQVVYPLVGPTNQVRIATTRGPQGFRNGPCWAAVMVDGVFLREYYSINAIDPGEVAAIEWYAGPSEIPVQYNRTTNTCGLLVIWTK